jgi:hypothetical protein
MGVTGLIRGIAAGIKRFTDYVRGNPTAGFITLAVVIALAALVTMAVQTSTSGPSEAEIEAACWAERQALVAEIAAVPEMGSSALKAAYGTSGKSYNKDYEALQVQAWLAKQLPDC